MTKISLNRKVPGKASYRLVLPSSQLWPQSSMARSVNWFGLTSPLLLWVDFILEFKTGHTLSNSPQAKLILQRLESSH